MEPKKKPKVPPDQKGEERGMAGLAAIGIGGLLLHQLLKDGDEPEPPPEGDFSSITAIFA